MPTIAENKATYEKALAEGTVTRAPMPTQPSAYPPPPTYPAAINQNFVAPLPANMWQSPDQQRQWQSGAVPQIRVIPRPAAANPTVGAAAASQAISVVANTPAPPPVTGTGITELVYDGPEFTIVDPNGPTTTIEKNPESASTFWAAPPAGLTGLEAIGQGEIADVDLTVTATGNTSSPWGLFTYETSGTFVTPAGWTHISSLTAAYTIQGSGIGPLSATVPGGGLDTSTVGALAVFTGAVPTVVQSANHNSTPYTGTLAFPGANTAGNTLMVVMQVNRGGGTANQLSMSVSDTNGNSYDPIISQATALEISPEFLSVLQNNVFIAPFCAGGANTVNYAYNGTPAGGDVLHLEIFEFTPFPLGAGVPFFRQIFSSDIPNLDASKITSGRLALARGGTHADLSGTGGASQVLQQSSTGANITVGQLAAADLSDGTTGTGAIVLAGSPTVTTPTWTAFTVAGLPAGATGQYAYATNGRKVGEGAGSGTGVPVYFSTAQWRVFSTDAQVLA